MKNDESLRTAICLAAIGWQVAWIVFSAFLAKAKGWKPALGALLGLCCGVFGPILILLVDIQKTKDLFKVQSTGSGEKLE